MTFIKERKCILTDRLEIGRAVLEDARFFMVLMNSPGWLHYIGDRGIKTEQDAKSYIESNLITGYEINGYDLIKVSLRQSKIPIEICCFLKRDYLEYADLVFAIFQNTKGKDIPMKPQRK